MPVSPALLPSALATEPLKRPVGAAARADRGQSAGFARSLAEADGARLAVQRRPDGTTFTVLMAAAPSADDSA